MTKEPILEGEGFKVTKVTEGNKVIIGGPDFISYRFGCKIGFGTQADNWTDESDAYMLHRLAERLSEIADEIFAVHMVKMKSSDQNFQ